jgi:tRNA threonylcarbamoyladenosine modification (KEOPS) complex  Pcc1 subunit
VKAKAAVHLNISTEKRLESLFNSLKPEVTNVASTRSRATLDKDGQFLTLRINAKDTVALRAALNAYLRWILSALSVLDVLETE